MTFIMKRKSALLLVVVAVALTSLLIYATPLRYQVPPPPMHEVDAKDIYTAMQKNPNDYLFIDVRDVSVYDAAHAVGAINIPIASLVTEHYLLPKTGKQIVLICTTGQLATVAYGYLQMWGFTNLLHITGGFSTWAIEGLPMEGTNVVNGVDTAPMVPDGQN